MSPVRYVCVCVCVCVCVWRGGGRQPPATQAGGGHWVPRRAGLPLPRLRKTSFILKSTASMLKKRTALLRSKERPEKTRGEKSLEAVGMQGQKPQSKYKRTRGKCRSCNVHISGHLRKRKSNQGRRADI